MFFEFTTRKGESIVINASKILKFYPIKNGTEIFFEDGDFLDVKEDFDSVCNRLSVVVSSDLFC